MNMMGRLSAAARGGRNVAAQGSAGTARVKAPRSESMKATIRSEGSSQGPAKGVNPGVMSNAGLNNGKSAYIQDNAAGYQRRSRPSYGTPGTPIAPYRPNIPPSTRMGDYRSSNYHGLRLDRDLSRML